MGGYKILLALSLLILSGCGSDNSGPTPRVEPVTGPPTYKGTENGRPCSITFHRQYQFDGKTGAENFRLEASTSYQHDGDGFGHVTLAFVDDRTLQFTDAVKDQFLRLGIKEPATTAANPTSFRVRWLHGDHHHDNTCTNLQLAAP